MVQDQGQAGAETEITPEMIASATAVAELWDLSAAQYEEFFTRVFIAMDRARVNKRMVLEVSPDQIDRNCPPKKS